MAQKVIAKEACWFQDAVSNRINGKLDNTSEVNTAVLQEI